VGVCMYAGGLIFCVFIYAKPSNCRRNFRPTRSVEAVVVIVNDDTQNVIDEIDTQIRMKVMQSGRQTARGLIIYRRFFILGVL